MNKPSSTITAAGIYGMIASVIMWALSTFLPDIALPAEAGAWIATAVAFIGGYFTKETVLPLK